MSEKNVWIVEYDIPVEPASKRRASIELFIEN